MPETYSCEDIQKLISKMELVENLARPGWLKVSGEEVYLAKTEDDFSKKLIRMIPEMYAWLRAFANNGNVEAVEKLREDLKIYLGQKESILAYHLQSSSFKNLLGEDNA